MTHIFVKTLYVIWRKLFCWKFWQIIFFEWCFFIELILMKKWFGDGKKSLENYRPYKCKIVYNFSSSYFCNSLRNRFCCFDVCFKAYKIINVFHGYVDLPHFCVPFRRQMAIFLTNFLGMSENCWRNCRWLYNCVVKSSIIKISKIIYYLTFSKYKIIITEYFIKSTFLSERLFNFNFMCVCFTTKYWVIYLSVNFGFCSFLYNFALYR